MSRWLSIDHGAKRIGIAAGNSSDGIASPLKTIPARPLAACLGQIGQIAGEYQVRGIVVGLPLNMDGTEGPQARLARELAAALAKAGDLEVRLWDERLSSFAADEALAGTMTRKKRRARQDAVAAAAILQDFFAAGQADATSPEEAGS